MAMIRILAVAPRLAWEGSDADLAKSMAQEVPLSPPKPEAWGLGFGVKGLGFRRTPYRGLGLCPESPIVLNEKEARLSKLY